MKQIAVLSGKGGTGKTILTACFASLSLNKIMLDCDVDAANLHILLHPDIKSKEEFKDSCLAVIDDKKCTECGICESVCRFEAIMGKKIDPVACEGCEVCFHMCPEDAIRMDKVVDGEWYVSETSYGPFVHARLGPGRPNSGKLVSLIRQKAQEIALQGNYEYVIIDGPPGMGCPVISTLSGVDLALITTEPTLSGIHDMDRVIQLANHFGIKAAVCINKHDLNSRMCQEIEKYCLEKNIDMVGKVRFDRVVPESVSQCIPVVEFSNNGVSEDIRRVWSNVLNVMGEVPENEVHDHDIM